MNPVKPPTPLHPDWEEFTYGVGQENKYLLLPGVANKKKEEEPFISTWEPSDEDMAYIKLCIERGEKPVISIEVWTFGYPLSPMRVVTGHFVDPYTVVANAAPSVPEPPEVM